jgi:hypothetical protein
VENVKLVYAFGDIVLQTRFDIIINATISNKLNVSECDDKKINPWHKKCVYKSTRVEIVGAVNNE